MIEYIKSITLFIVLGVLAIKYLTQFYYAFSNRKQKIILKGKPFVSSAVIWLISLSIFGVFVFQRHAIGNHFIGLITLLIGIVIGVWGLVNLKNNYHENLAKYENSSLVKNGIYSVVRHPIRVGICCETFSLILFINSIYLIPFFLFYLYLNYKRTKTEEIFLISVFDEKAEQYFAKVPKFNIIYGLLLKLRVYRTSQRICIRILQLLIPL